MANIDYNAASCLLEDIFQETVTNFPEEAQSVLNRLHNTLDTIFDSNTQSYREVLLGCALVHIMHPNVNIRLPYVKQGPNAFNGRTFDQEVVNQFLVSKQIPCSKGPYLATFRRNVKFDESTREGLRDKTGYDAMLEILGEIEDSQEDNGKAILMCLIQKFIELREKSDIQLVSVVRLSVEQYRYFLDTLLHNQSGGLITMLVTEAIFHTINVQYGCGWDIARQGINAADGATGAAGDVTIFKNGEVVKAIEVTERPIGQTRVITTFNPKIATSDVKDYLFIYTSAPPDDGAYAAAKAYFAQGYDINFIKLGNFAISTFIAGNANSRAIFMNKMLELLRQVDIPAAVKTAWNDSLQATIRANNE